MPHKYRCGGDRRLQMRVRVCKRHGASGRGEEEAAKNLFFQSCSLRLRFPLLWRGSARAARGQCKPR